MLLQYLLEPDPTQLPTPLAPLVLTFPFDLSYLIPQDLHRGQENPMCQNKLFSKTPSGIDIPQPLSSCMHPVLEEQSCNARNAETHSVGIQAVHRKAVLCVMICL